jgi:glycerophosphoryl diester phosphodiesterase
MKRVHLPSNVNIKPPELIAHRGYALRYPENSLPSFRAAIEAGARYVECDVQLTVDGVPVLLHDSDLWRTADDDRDILDMTLDDVMQVEVNETQRLGPRFTGVNVPLLGEFVSLLEEHADVTAFVEIKRASLRRFGVEHVVETVLHTLRPALARCVVISFDRAAIEHARASGAKAIGLVLEEWSDKAKTSATDLKPDYLFCDYRMIPDDAELWSGPWHWALYEVIDAELALMLSAFGAEFVETMAIKEILADRRLIPRRPPG